MIEKELITSQAASANTFFKAESPLCVFLATAGVGGISANNVYRGEFINQNLMMQNNVIYTAYENSVDRLVFLGASSIAYVNDGFIKHAAIAVEE